MDKCLIVDYICRLIMINIAAIVVAFEDGYQLYDYVKYYEKYSGCLYKHIIVDNGSSQSYIADLKRSFPESLFVLRSSNDGTTAAFNAGINLALDDHAVDAILLTVQDVEMEPSSLAWLCELLLDNPSVAGVGGVVFQSGADGVVESYGGQVDWNTFVLHPNYNGCRLEELPKLLEVDFIPGGICLIKREAFEMTGNQDEHLFMYCDELDWIYRAKKLGFKFMVTKSAKIWHQHKVPLAGVDRAMRANFYTFRNRVYLVGKHHGAVRKIQYTLKSIISIAKDILVRVLSFGVIDRVLFARLIGTFYGLFDVMGRQLYAESNKHENTTD